MLSGGHDPEKVTDAVSLGTLRFRLVGSAAVVGGKLTEMPRRDKIVTRTVGTKAAVHVLEGPGTETLEALKDPII
jgi:hypothetical protein